MNCSEFDEIVHDLDRPGVPADLDRSAGDGLSQSEAALAHAESCSRCGRVLTEVEGLNFALHSIASHDAPLLAPVRLEATLLREFRRQSVRPIASRVAKRQTFRWYAAVAGVAALALFGLGLARIRMGLNAHRVETAVAPTSAVQSGSVKEPLQTGHEVVATKASPTNESANDAGELEDANAFYPLPYADDTASFDGGAVIRVSVPRSALASWGLPVSGAGGAGPVPADVIVSEDGTPQAIRLVSQTNE